MDDSRRGFLKSALAAAWSNGVTRGRWRAGRKQRSQRRRSGASLPAVPYARSLRVCSTSTSLMSVWQPTRRRRASLRNASRTVGSTRMAIN